MLRVDLGQLDREGSVDVEAGLAPDDATWEETDLHWVGDVHVRLRATYAGSGEVVARGAVDGTLRQACRRCLRPVEVGFRNNLTLVFVSDESEVDGDAGAYPLPRRGALDLSSAVREEVVLAVNPYVVCAPDCPGFCAKCGEDLRDGPCGCTEDETDPRWAALRSQKDE